MSDNTLFRVADLIVGRPLLVTPAKAEVVLYALQNRLNLADADRPTPDAAARFMARRDRDKNSPTINGTAVVPIVGSLANRYSFENSCAGIQSYEQISIGVRSAIEDPDVHSILLDIDSPGGEATGMFRLAHLIREARKTKRVVAFVDDMAASAAYGLASQAHEIVVSPTSIVGSIGVVLVHLDRSAELEQRGVKPTLIHAGAHKVDGNSFGPLSSEVRADLQAEVLTFYEQFVATVSMGARGSPPTPSGPRRRGPSLARSRSSGASRIASPRSTRFSRTSASTAPSRRGPTRENSAWTPTPPRRRDRDLQPG